MKKTTRILISLLLCVVSVSFFGCGVTSPSNTVKDYLEQVKKGENSDFSNLLNETLEKGEKKKEQAKEDELTKKIGESIKKMEYTINSEKIDGNNATVNVKVKGPDLASVMTQYIQKSMSMAFSEAFSDKKSTEKQIDKLYGDLFIQCLKDMKFSERTGDISLTKVDGKWKINNNGSLTKLIMNIDDSILNVDKK